MYIIYDREYWYINNYAVAALMYCQCGTFKEALLCLKVILDLHVFVQLFLVLEGRRPLQLNISYQTNAKFWFDYYYWYFFFFCIFLESYIYIHIFDIKLNANNYVQLNQLRLHSVIQNIVRLLKWILQVLSSIDEIWKCITEIWNQLSSFIPRILRVGLCSYYSTPYL